MKLSTLGSAVGIVVSFTAGMVWAGQVNVINPASSAGSLGRVVIVVPSVPAPVAPAPVTPSVSTPVSSVVPAPVGSGGSSASSAATGAGSAGSGVSSEISVAAGAERADLLTSAQALSGLSARHQVVSVAISNTVLPSVATPELRTALVKIEGALRSSRISPGLRARLEAEVQRINAELGGR